MLSSVLEDSTVVLHCCQGDLGDTGALPGSSEDPGLAPGLGVRGPGQDGVQGTAIIASSQIYHLSKSGSPETRARGGKLAGLPPPSCRGGVVQQLGAGQARAAGDDEDLERDIAPPLPARPYLGLPHGVVATGMVEAAGDVVGQLPGGHLAAEVGVLGDQGGGVTTATEDDGGGADLGEEEAVEERRGAG